MATERMKIGREIGREVRKKGLGLWGKILVAFLCLFPVWITAAIVLYIHYFIGHLW